MAYTERFTADISLNTKQAQSHLNLLKRDLEALEKQKNKAISKGDKEQVIAIQKEMDILSDAYKKEEKYVQGLKSSMKDLSKVSYRELQLAHKALVKELLTSNIEKGSEEWNTLTKKII